MKNTEKLDVLAVSPHPDEAEICCGGLLIKLSKLKYNIGVVTLSLGELTSFGNLEIRARESEAAAKVLGIRYRENLSLPDGELGSNYSTTANQQLSTMVRLIRRLQPEMLICPYRQSSHPDLAGTSELMNKAVFFAGLEKFEKGNKLAPFTVNQVIYYQERFQFRPSFITDISEVIEQKIAAIQCYKSQLEGKVNPNQTGSIYNSPLELVELRDRYFGTMIGAEYAEPYYTKNVLSLADPFKHFKENQTSNSYYFFDKAL